MIISTRVIRKVFRAELIQPTFPLNRFIIRLIHYFVVFIIIIIIIEVYFLTNVILKYKCSIH
jgi:hypothetical protein